MGPTCQSRRCSSQVCRAWGRWLQGSSFAQPLPRLVYSHTSVVHEAHRKAGGEMGGFSVRQ